MRMRRKLEIITNPEKYKPPEGFREVFDKTDYYGGERVSLLIKTRSSKNVTLVEGIVTQVHYLIGPNLENGLQIKLEDECRKALSKEIITYRFVDIERGFKGRNRYV